MRCSFFVGFHTHKKETKSVQKAATLGSLQRPPYLYAPCLIYTLLKSFTYLRECSIYRGLQEKILWLCRIFFRKSRDWVQWTFFVHYVQHWKRTILFIKIFLAVYLLLPHTPFCWHFSCLFWNSPPSLFLKIKPAMRDGEAFTLPLRLFHVRMFPPRLILCSRCPWMIDFCALFFSVMLSSCTLVRSLSVHMNPVTVFRGLCCPSSREYQPAADSSGHLAHFFRCSTSCRL